MHRRPQATKSAAVALELLRSTVARLGLDKLGLRAIEVDLAVLAREHLARALARRERLGLVEIGGIEEAVEKAKKVQ